MGQTMHPVVRSPRVWACCLAVLAALLLSVPAWAQQRIITIGGDITETVYALGAGQQIVATDTTSHFPRAAQDLPRVGYLRGLSAEGLLSMRPDLLIISGAAGPEATLQLIRRSGVSLLEFASEYDPSIIHHKIDRIAQALQRTDAARALHRQVNADLEQLRATRMQLAEQRSVLFFATLRDGAPRAAGRDTAAQGLIDLLGGENVFAQQSGYKSLSLEAAVQADPDWILVLRNYAMQDQGAADAARHPALALTRAARQGRIFMVDVDPLLQFGPRTPAAALDLLHAMLSLVQPSSP